MTHRLAVDAGQTSSKIRGDATGDTSGAPIDTSRPRIPQLAAIVRAAAPDGAERVLVGTTGLGLGETAALLLERLEPYGTREVFLAHDSITSYLGALGDLPGCVVAGGTGCVTLAVGPESAVRVDGWGWLMGDCGAAFWIGRRALEMAMKGYDGRGRPTALTDVVARDFPDIESAYLDLQADPDKVQRIAGYAAVVDRLAPSDPVASDILIAAGAELAESVGAGLRRVDAAPDAPVCAIGNVFVSQGVRQGFAGRLAELAPHGRIVAARGTGLDGADLLDQVTTGLTSRIDVARV